MATLNEICWLHKAQVQSPISWLRIHGYFLRWMRLDFIYEIVGSQIEDELQHGWDRDN